VVVTAVSDDGDADVIATGAGPQCHTAQLSLEQGEAVIVPEEDPPEKNPLDKKIIVP
jgi:hypothetical protein